MDINLQFAKEHFEYYILYSTDFSKYFRKKRNMDLTYRLKNIWKATFRWF